MSNRSTCYCGSKKPFSDCCEPIISQQQITSSAEQLMRSRFSAFYVKNVNWLKQSWDKTTCPQDIQFEDNLKWLDLTILNRENIDELNSTVEFEARYFKGDKVSAIHENSRFIKRDGAWFYVNGEYLKTTFKPFKLGRNDLCPCQSGKKFKRCCGA